VVLGVLIATTGCREIQVTTRVNRNGSCERVIVVESDSSGIGETAYPMPDDESWSMDVTLNEEDKEGDSYFYTMTKQFRSVDDLNNELSRSAGTGLHISSRVELTRRHRWFTTFVSFRETYEPYFPFRSIPISEYFTPEEIERLRGEEEDKELEKRMEEWQTRNMFEELFQGMLDGASGLNDPDLTPDVLTAEKEELYATLIPAAEESYLEELTPVILETCEKVYGTDAVNRLRPQAEEFEQKFNEFSDFTVKAAEESYKHTVIMPGLIYDTNASDVQWNSVTWNLGPGDFSYAEYEMWVESRTTNRTAIWLTVIVIAALLALLVLTLLRRGPESGL
jgi:hypothetical protein